MANGDSNDKWRLGREIPLALIVTIVLQTGVFVWWAARIDFRTDTLERDHVAVSIRVDALEKERTPQAERVIRVETKLDAIKETVTEIKNLLRMPQDQRR